MNDSPYMTDIFQYDAADYGPKDFVLDQCESDMESIRSLIDVRRPVIVGFGNPVQFESRETVTSVEMVGDIVTHIWTRDFKGNQRLYVWEPEDFAFYEAEKYNRTLALIEVRRIRIE